MDGTNAPAWSKDGHSEAVYFGFHMHWSEYERRGKCAAGEPGFVRDSAFFGAEAEAIDYLAPSRAKAVGRHVPSGVVRL
jgi:hypothetical protein